MVSLRVTFLAPVGTIKCVHFDWTLRGLSKIRKHFMCKGCGIIVSNAGFGFTLRKFRKLSVLIFTKFQITLLQLPGLVRTPEPQQCGDKSAQGILQHLRTVSAQLPCQPQTVLLPGTQWLRTIWVIAFPGLFQLTTSHFKKFLACMELWILCNIIFKTNGL